MVMKAQTIFEKVARHLFTQGLQSRNVLNSGHTLCLYRDGKGNSCAVGCLLSDTFYNRYLKKIEENEDTMSIVGLFEELPRQLKHLEPHQYLLEELQGVHDYDDYWDSSDMMRNALECVANNYGLKSKFLQKLKFSDGR